jgi:CheY-like chemotaxis protein
MAAEEVKPLIMVVDDEVSVVGTLCMIFEKNGYATIAAYSGNEALSKLAENCPHLLFADISMQGINGFETALKLKAVCPDCRLLFISGHPETSAASGGNLTLAGCDFEVLPKPIHPAELLKKIKAVLELSV